MTSFLKATRFSFFNEKIISVPIYQKWQYRRNCYLEIYKEFASLPLKISGVLILVELFFSFP